MTYLNTGISDNPRNCWHLNHNSQKDKCRIDGQQNAPCKGIGQLSCYKQDSYFLQGYIHMAYNLWEKKEKLRNM